MGVPYSKAIDLRNRGTSIGVGGIPGGSNIYGVPGGGLEGQVLTKNTDNDYDYSWEDLDIPVSVLNIRQNYTAFANGLADGANSQFTIPLGKSYRLIAISTNVPARIRLYDTVAHQAADVNRTIGTDPGDGSGLMFEYVTTLTLLNVSLTPQADGSNMESTVSINIPITINNLSGSTNDVHVTFVYFVTEE